MVPVVKGEGRVGEAPRGQGRGRPISSNGLVLYWCDGHCSRSFEMKWFKITLGRVDDLAQFLLEGGALDFAYPCVPVEGLRRSDDRRSRRRDGRGTAKPVFRLWGETTVSSRVLLRETPRRSSLSPRRHSSRRKAVRDSLASLLRFAVERCHREGCCPACLLAGVAPLVNDAEVRQFLQNAAVAAVPPVERRFRDAISAGEIPSDFPVAASRQPSH